MGFFRKAFNSTVGVALRAPVAAVKTFDVITDSEQSLSEVSDRLGDTLDYAATGKSEEASYDGVADFNQKGK
jgi:hypothetical protein